ncbi:MAG TPA: phage holin family protein [Terriglobia bacterium]|nr:phage holin family protein [Terriglobia bacterium]
MKEKSNMNNQFENVNDIQAYSKSGDRSISQIIEEILNHVTEIIRSEVRLAEAEVRQGVTEIAKAGRFFIIGAVFALYGIAFVLLGVVYALGTSIPLWLSAILVGACLSIGAAIFVQVGRTRMNQANLKPDQTIRSLQENVTWFKTRTK